MKLLINFLLIGVLFSCNNDKYQSQKTTIKSICKKERLSGPENKMVYLVTGLDGCNACLEHTVDFIEKNTHNQQVTFIVSGKSKVQLEYKFKQSTIHSPNFVLDTALVALKTRLVDSGFPKVYLCEGDKIIDTFEVNYVTAKERFNYAKNFINDPD